MNKESTLIKRCEGNIGDPSSTSDAFQYMGGNLCLSSWKGQMPIELFPKEQKEQLLKACLNHEVVKLERMLMRAHFRNVREEEEIVKLIHLYSILYCRYSKAEDFKEDVDKFYAYAMLKEEEILNFVKGSYLDTSDGFWKLLDEQKKLYRVFTSKEDNQSYDREDGKASFHSVLTEALKLCSERKFPFLLHLLVVVAKIDVDKIIDDMCMTRALHHAAISGNLSAISYLLNKGADLSVQDKYKCTPLHYANMFGHKMTSEYLISQDVSQSVIDIKCSNGYTAHDYSEALSEYMKIREVDQDCLAFVHNDAYSITLHHLQRLETNWMKNGIVESVNKITVDLKHDEAADVQKAVLKTMEILLLQIADKNPIFKGELVQLGSSADGVRLFCPDEFDFNLIFSNKMSGFPGGGLKVEIKEHDKQTAANKGHECYVSVTPISEDLSQWAKGSELLPEFLRLMKICLRDFCFEDSRLSIVPPGVRHKMVGIGLTLRWCGEMYPLLLIDIDLVPVVHSPYPENLYHPPLLTDDVQSIYASTSLKNEWRLSSGILENKIMLNLTKVQKDVFIACKRLVSTLKVDGWMPIKVKQQYRYFDNQLFRVPILNGFILKNCFYQEMEERRDTEDWHEDRLLERVESIFQRMCNLDNDGSGYYVPSLVYAYFGGANFTTENGEKVVKGATDKAYVGYGAPDIIGVIHSLKSHQNHVRDNSMPSTSKN